MDAFLWSISFVTDFVIDCLSVITANRILSLFILMFVVGLFVTALTGRERK